MNIIKKINIIVFNISNDIIKRLSNKHYSIFNNQIIKIEQKYKGIQNKRGSIRYYHVTSSPVLAMDPLVLEKTANDFNFWLLEINRVVFGLIESVLTYVRSDNGKTSGVNKELMDKFHEDLKRISDDIPSKHDLQVKFQAQGGNTLPKIDVYEQYTKEEWFKALSNGINMCDNVITNLNSLINTITILNAHIDKLKKHNNAVKSNTKKELLDLNDDVLKLMNLELKINSILSDRIDIMVKYSMFRFVNFHNALNIIDKNLKMALKEE